MACTLALAGNPNSGKTTLFNELTGSHQHVGNWPGVTVDKKDGTYKKNKDIKILDLPGTYSLSPYSAEEKIAQDYIVMASKSKSPAAVIDILDGTNIERNLYLALQIIESGVPTVLALNMMDEVKKRGDSIDTGKLGELLGCKVIPISARNDKNFDALMHEAEAASKTKITEIKKTWDDGDTEDVIADKRYKFIASICKKCVVKTNNLAGKIGETTSDKMDKVLTNRWLALPIFAAVMYLLFACTFSENFLFIRGLQSPGVALAGLVETGWGALSDVIASAVSSSPAWLQSLLIDGILGGIGAVLGFLPLVLVLYILMSFLEDAGYMARVAFVMDRLFRRFGLSGRAFIPLLMGFGCSVPGISATRTLESEKDRKITTVLCGFMPCGAKMPIFAMFVAIFFSTHATLAMFSIYFTSIVVAIIISLILNRIHKGETSAFIMELPQYRWPTLKSVLIHGWEKIKGFAIKAGKIIFISTIILWLLSGFNFNSFNGKNLEASSGETVMCDMNDSFLASASGIISPIFKPLGFGGTINGVKVWRPTVGVITGWIAKEMVVVTFSQLYKTDLSDYFEEAEFEGSEDTAIPSIENGFQNSAAVLAFMLFNLLCMPCFAAVGAMRQELGSAKETLKGVGIQMATAYIVGLLVFVIGSLFC